MTLRALVAVFTLAMASGCGDRRADHSEAAHAGSAAGAGGAPSADEFGGAGAGGREAEPLPSFTQAELTLIASLSPETLPAPAPDPSNAQADDPAAQALGKKLFFESGFSGALLDHDNDGGPNTLGQKGESGKVSCAGCHVARDGYLDTRSTFQEISLGSGWTTRRTPSLLDVGQAKLVMWGGKRSTLYSQVFGPLENPLEMNSSRLYVARFVAEQYEKEYEAIFGSGSLDALGDQARFPVVSPNKTGCQLTQALEHPRTQPPDAIYECHGFPGDGAEYDGMAEADQNLVTRVVVNVGKTIAAFERRLSCGATRFDAWAHGADDAMNASEQRGLKLFVGKAGCVKCHSGPYFSDQDFHNLGLMERETREGILNGDDHGAGADLDFALSDPIGIGSEFSDGDDGRLPSSVGPEYEGAFRTPTLRCVNLRPTFMHSGVVLSLEEAVAFLNRGGDHSGFVGKSELLPLGLEPSEQGDLVAFLKALDGPAEAAP